MHKTCQIYCLVLRSRNVSLAPSLKVFTQEMFVDCFLLGFTPKQKEVINLGRNSTVLCLTALSKRRKP